MRVAYNSTATWTARSARRGDPPMSSPKKRPYIAGPLGVVFTLPASLGVLAFQNKAAVYDLHCSDPLPTRCSRSPPTRSIWARHQLDRHPPHLGLGAHPSSARPHPSFPVAAWSPDGSRWTACMPGFFLPVRVPSRLFRRPPPLNYSPRSAAKGPAPWPSPAVWRRSPTSARFRRTPRPFAPLPVGSSTPSASHGRAPSRARLSLSLHPPRRDIRARSSGLDQAGVTFRWKDYRNQRLRPAQDLRRLTPPVHSPLSLLHVLPNGFHRIHHYGLFAGVRAHNIERVRPIAPATPEASPEELAQRGGQRSHRPRRCVHVRVARPADRRAPVRRRAFFALAVAEPDQDRHLMTVAALPATRGASRVSLPATRRSGPP